MLHTDAALFAAISSSVSFRVMSDLAFSSLLMESTRAREPLLVLLPARSHHVTIWPQSVSLSGSTNCLDRESHLVAL